MATGNPLIDQGTLNRIRASITWQDFPGLNVTAPYLDKEGITARMEGDASLQHGTMTGVVQSPEPYLFFSVVIALLRTQQLSNAYKVQMEALSIIGAGTVYPDVSTGLGPFPLNNVSIQSVGELLLNGTTPIYGVTCRGYYTINQALFST